MPRPPSRPRPRIPSPRLRVAALGVAAALVTGLDCSTTPVAPVTERAVGRFTASLWESGRDAAGPGVDEVHVGLVLENGGAAATGVVVTAATAASGLVLEDAQEDVGDLPRDAAVARTSALRVRVPAGAPLPLDALELAVAAATARDAAGYEIDPPGEWLAGDLHVHATGASNDTGGDSYPEAIAQVAQQRGLAFVVLTDHSNSTGSDVDTTYEDPALFNRGPEFPYFERAAELSVPGAFLMIDGNELSPRDPGSAPTGHVGCLPQELASFDLATPFVDRPMGSVDGAATLVQARLRGCYVVLEHPYAALPWIAFDWTSHDYDAMEIWNGGLGVGLTPIELQSRDAWRCDLLAGRGVTPIASSDNHRVNTPEPGRLTAPALGWPQTSVRARERSWSALLAGLRAGQVALHGGASRLFLDGYDALRERAEDASLRRLRLRGALDAAAPPSTLVLTRATACADGRPGTVPAIDETVLRSQAIAPGESFDLGVDVSGEPGVYAATLLPTAGVANADGQRAALSRAIVVRTPPAPAATAAAPR